MAVGYVCVSGDEDLVNGLHGRLTGHADRAGLDLIEIYVDRSTAVDAVRPGLQLAVDEIARRSDAILLVPNLSHLPATAAGPATFSEQFSTVVTEIHVLDAPPASRLALAVAPAAAAPAASPTPEAAVSRARLTAKGLFEAIILPDDDVASVIATLRQLPAAAQFLEALGDVETTLVFAPAPLSTDNAARLGDLVPLPIAGPTGSAGRDLVGLTDDDVAVRLRTALAGIPLGSQDEEVLAWLTTQAAERALTISGLLQRARTRAA